MKGYFILCIIGSLAFGQVVRDVVSLQYISPAELMQELHTQYAFNEQNKIVLDDQVVHLTFNKSTNKVLVAGAVTGVDNAKKLIAFLDVPPRQIVIEAKIIEINNDRLSELGMDWQTLMEYSTIHLEPYYYRNDHRETYQGSETGRITEETNIGTGLGTGIRLGDFLKIIQDKGVGQLTSVPKIVTTNNREGMILDGSRLTYVAKYSGYGEIFEAQEMTAGLSLAVTPSLGVSGYIRLDIRAKITTLSEMKSGSPVETGQIIENSIVVEEGQEFLLGGFNTTQTEKYKRKVPILGTVLPFLFSRTKDVTVTRDFLIVLKPVVIDLEPMEIPEIE